MKNNNIDNLNATRFSNVWKYSMICVVCIISFIASQWRNHASKSKALNSRNESIEEGFLSFLVEKNSILIFIKKTLERTLNLNARNS